MNEGAHSNDINIKNIYIHYPYTLKEEEGRIKKK